MSNIVVPDHYKTLEVARDASDDQIKSAYRKLAKKYHPDVNKEAGAEDRFKAVATAYDTLISPMKRMDYDAMLRVQEAQNLPPDDFDLALSDVLTPPRRSKKAKKSKKHRNGGGQRMASEEIPEGFLGDDSMGGIL